jgi:Zn finger protein HypA/HybF involved in hydrogenase expression
MDILTLIISLALGGGALALIFYPLWQQTRPEAIFHIDRSGQTLEEYQARYQAILAAIKDLMFDHEMGKVSTEDYQDLLARTKIEAAEIRQQIDRLSRRRETAEADPAREDEIETLIAQAKSGLLTNGNEPLLREIEAEVETLKHINLPDGDTAEMACPQCGTPYVVGDAFCTGCGYAVGELETTPTCPECQLPVEPDDAFCARCGTALKENENVVTG